MLNYRNDKRDSLQHFDVVIVTPGSSFKSQYVKSLVSTIKLLEQNNISWKFQSEYSSIVTNSREASLTGSVSQDPINTSPGKGAYSYKKIFCIDSDISWEPEQFLKLYLSEKNVISGVYYGANGEQSMVFGQKNTIMNRKDLSRLRDPFICFGVGLGFMCVKNGVFEQFKRPWFQLGKEAVNFGNQVIEVPVGEDLYFCERVRQNGNDVWVDPSIVVGHVKEVLVC